MRASQAVTLAILGVAPAALVVYAVMTPDDDTARNERLAKAQYVPREASPIVPEDELASAPGVVQRNEERRSSGGGGFVYVPVHTYSTYLMPSGGSSYVGGPQTAARTAPAPAQARPTPAPAPSPSSTAPSSRGGFGATGSSSGSGGSS